MPAVDFALALPYARLRGDPTMRPMLRVTGHNPEPGTGRFPMIALVDSGANVPMFNTRIAAAIGLDLATGRRSHVVGVGGRFDMVEIAIQLDLLGRRFPGL